MLVGADVSGRCTAAGAGVSDLLDLVVVLILRPRRVGVPARDFDAEVSKGIKQVLNRIRV